MFLGTLRQPTRFSDAYQTLSFPFFPSPPTNSPESLYTPTSLEKDWHAETWAGSDLEEEDGGAISHVALDVPVSRVCELRIPHVKLLDG